MSDVYTSKAPVRTTVPWVRDSECQVRLGLVQTNLPYRENTFWYGRACLSFFWHTLGAGELPPYRASHCERVLLTQRKALPYTSWHLSPVACKPPLLPPAPALPSVPLLSASASYALAEQHPLLMGWISSHSYPGCLLCIHTLHLSIYLCSDKGQAQDLTHSIKQELTNTFGGEQPILSLFLHPWPLLI